MAVIRPKSSIVAPVSDTVILTNSARSLYRNCQEAYHQAYENKFELKVPQPFQAIGGTMGIAFQSMFLRHDMQDVLSELRQGVAAQRRLFIGNPDPFEKSVSILEGMVLGWDQNRGILEDAEVVMLGDRPMVEMPFEIDMGRGLILKGAIDGLVRKKTGLWLVENKCLALSILPKVATTLPLNRQLTTYFFGMQLALPPDLSTQVRGIIYNVIGKTAIRQKQGESLAAFQERVVAEYMEPENRSKYYLQQTVFRNDAQVALSVQRLHDTADDIRRSRKTGRWDQNEQFCTHFAGCQFLDMCTKGRKPEVMSKYKVREFLHQEVDMEE